MKLNSRKNLLGLVFVVLSTVFVSFQLSSCKKDDSTQTTLVVTVLDSASNPISGAYVKVYVKQDTTQRLLPKPVPGLPKVQYTGGNGQTTFLFDNGIIVYIEVKSGSLSETSFATMGPGETFYRKVTLKRYP